MLHHAPGHEAPHQTQNHYCQRQRRCYLVSTIHPTSLNLVDGMISGRKQKMPMNRSPGAFSLFTLHRVAPAFRGCGKTQSLKATAYSLCQPRTSELGLQSCGTQFLKATAYSLVPAPDFRAAELSF